MPQQGPLRWLDGEGWLVLSGGGDRAQGETDQVDAQLLSVANLDRPMVVLLSEGSHLTAEDVLEHYVTLGGPGGEGLSLSELTRERLADPDLLSLLGEAGIVYLGGENPLPLVRTLNGTPAFRRILEGFVTLQGLTIIGDAGGAMALGSWVVDPQASAAPVAGLGLVNVVAVPHFTRTEDFPALQNLPHGNPPVLGLGIPNGSALALGPLGQVETWGSQQVTAVLRADT